MRKQLVRSLSTLLFLINQCHTKDAADLQKTWRVDSVYTYYNRFEFTRHDVEQEPLCHYQPDGRLRMTRGNEFRFFLYELHTRDTLVHRRLDAKIFEKFLILKLDRDQLVLKKDLSPLFKGNNQERYEIRYFSSVEK